MVKSIKVHSGPNVMTLPQRGDRCAYCKAEMPDEGLDKFLWVVCSPECDLAMSYLLDGCSEAEVREKWEGMRADPEKLKAAIQRIEECVFIEPPLTDPLKGGKVH